MRTPMSGTLASLGGGAHPTSGAARQGLPPHGSISPPPARNVAFCARAAGVRRTNSCGSSRPVLGVLASGGTLTRAAPASQYTIAEPPNGYAAIGGIPHDGLACGERPAGS